MRLLLLSISVLLPAVSLQAPAQDGGGREQHTYTVIINNTCRQDIDVAIHYRDPELGWVTRGWWHAGGGSEVTTGLQSDHFQFFMHGETGGRKQWPPARSSKPYQHFEIIKGEDFLFTDKDSGNRADTVTVPFSLKEVSPESPGLKARFDC